MSFLKSEKLQNVCYDIRGPVMAEAKRLEEEGYHIVKLNIGNPGIFGLDTPDELLHDVGHNLRSAQSYCDAKGLYSARTAIRQYSQSLGIRNVDVEDITIGNGVSELIVMCMQGLLNAGDEVLIPSPDYPLWTAAVTLAGGTPVHYVCDEQCDWQPDMSDIRKKATSRTKAIVVINPNNPTGAVYSKALLEQIVDLAREKKLIVFADEIYDKILYDDARHQSIAALADDVFFVTLNGLSKNYRAAGFRAGWAVLSGDKAAAGDYIEGLDILSNMRLCSNVPGQFAIQTSLGGYQSIDDLVRPGGRLREQRDAGYDALTQIPGVTCVKPRGALYFFPKLDMAKFKIKDDRKFVFDLLAREHILVVQGTGFHWPQPDHFRVVFLPRQDELTGAIQNIGHFLASYAQ